MCKGPPLMPKTANIEKNLNSEKKLKIKTKFQN